MTVPDRAYWLADADGAWSIGSNWATQVPGSNPATYTATVPSGSYDVSLTPPAGTAPFTITYDTTDTVYDLRGSAYATLGIVGGSLTIASYMTLGGALTLSSLGTLRLENAGLSSTVFGAFTNAGTVSVLSGKMAFSGAATNTGRVSVADGTVLTVSSFENQTGGTIDLVGSAGIAGGASNSTLTNAGGTLIKEIEATQSTVTANYNGTAGVINVRSGTLTFIGANDAFADQIVGSGTFAIGSDAYVFALINTGTITTAGFTLSSATVTFANSLRYGGIFSAIGDSSLFFRGVTLTLTGNTRIVGRTSAFDDTTYLTEGIIVVSGATLLGNVWLTQGILFINTGTVTQTGMVVLHSGYPGAPSKLANRTGGIYNIAGNTSLQGDAIALFENQGGTLTKTAGAGTADLSISLVGSGGQIRVDSGTLLLAGTSSQLTAQTISGAGIFALGGAGFTLIDAGTTISTAAFAVSAAETIVALGEDLAYAGSFTQSAGSTINLRDHMLTLSGTVAFAGGMGSGQAIGITGTGTLALSGATTITYANVLASVHVSNTGSVEQSRILGLGDANNGASAIVNAAGATWALGNGAVIAGTSASSFDNGGTLAKTTGAGHALVNTAIVNSGSGTGTIDAGAGVLELGGTVSGKQALSVGAGASLVLDRSVTADSAFAFGGADATLQLIDAQDYHGTIAGFAATETLDLRDVGFGTGLGTTLGYSGSSTTGTLTVSDGTHTANLAMLGNYTQANFTLGTDSHGGSAITFA